MRELNIEQQDYPDHHHHSRRFSSGRSFNQDALMTHSGTNRPILPHNMLENDGENNNDDVPDMTDLLPPF